MTEVDVIVVGQGLAGSALAWQLHSAGKRLLVCDRGEPATASRIAAGLITPITGKRLVKTDWFDQSWPLAVKFYQQVERETSTTFFHPCSSVRLLRTEQQRQIYQRRLESGEFEGLTQEAEPSLPDCFHAAHGTFEMLRGGRLDVPTYLEVSRDWFRDRGEFVEVEIEPGRDVVLDCDGVRVDKLNVRAGRLVFCQGISARDNPWFPQVKFNPAKGEILTLDIPGLSEERTVHAGIWLAKGRESFRCGSTYEWNDLDNVPTTVGRDQILERLSAILQLPVTVVGHHAAVRPTMHDFRPVIGIHRQHPQLGYFNGLGSKGALRAPWLAMRLVERLGGALGVADCDLRRFE